MWPERQKHTTGHQRLHKDIKLSMKWLRRRDTIPYIGAFPFETRTQGDTMSKDLTHFYDSTTRSPCMP